MKVEYTEAQIERRLRAFNIASKLSLTRYGSNGNYVAPSFEEYQAAAAKILAFAEGNQEDVNNLLGQPKGLLCDKKA